MRTSTTEVIGTQAPSAPDLREEFEQHHWVRIPGFLSGYRLERVHDWIESGDFEVLEHGGLKTELCMPAEAPAYALLYFLSNDPRLFEFVREITGCARIGCFTGRVYKMMPGLEHEDSWHNDLMKDRMVAMSVNLSEAPYSGGLIEIRDSDSKEILERVPNTGRGDAIMFRLDRSLEHRVTAVEGDAPKTAYAGWFRSEPESELLSPEELLARDG
jgi:hypothetical protein